MYDGMDAGRVRGTSFAAMTESARQVVAAFAAVERRPWTVETALIELAKQVGDLARKVLTHEGYYLADRDAHPGYAGGLGGVADELADILYGAIRIGLHYGIDLETAYATARGAELGYAAHAPRTWPVAGQTSWHPPGGATAAVVRYHYEEFLGPHFDWMQGGFETASARAARLLTNLAVVAGTEARALDLGAGSGAYSLPLAEAGFAVTAVDLSPLLLETLTAHAEGLGVRAIEADVLDPSAYADGAPYDLVVCMGDSLTHLASEQQVWQLMRTIAGLGRTGTRLLLSYRDLSGPIGQAGGPTIIPVRIEADRMLFALLGDAGAWVTTTDLLLLRDGDGWQVGQHSYAKLRLPAQRCISLLGAAGFDVEYSGVSDGLHVVAARLR